MNNRIIYSLRNIKRNRLNAIITTVGLSIALASVLIIYLFVIQEKSYNSFLDNADRIFRLDYKLISKDGSEGADNLVTPDMYTDLKDKVPQIEHCTPFRIGYMAQLELPERNMKHRLGIAEQPFFDMFSFDLLYGNRESLLTNPTNIVITRSLAQKLLSVETESIEELMGKSLKFTFIDETRFTVVGIIDDLPMNSTIDFEALIPFRYEDFFWQSNNGFGNSSIFIQIKEGLVTNETSSLISETVREYCAQTIARGQRNNILHPSPSCFQAYLTPIKNTYLDKSVDAAYERNGNLSKLNILTVVAILILFIALSNYVILTIGQFFKKASEVSIRKSVGGGNLDIFKMFLNENSLLIITSFIVGGVLCYLLVPVFNNISQSHIHFNLVSIPALLIFSFLIIILLIGITSSIPVFLFKKIKPTMMASKNFFSRKKFGMSQLFVGLQYSLSIILIIATIVINKQAQYLKNKSLGFSDENIISVDVPYLKQSTSIILRDILQKQTGVINAALTNRNYFDGYSSNSFEVSNTEVIQTYTFKADNHFISTLNIDLLAGRNFSEDDIKPGDRSVIANEEFIKGMNIKGNPVGQTVTDGNSRYNIIGVVKNYQFLTSRNKILPMVLYSDTRIGNSYSALLIKYDPRNISNVISAIESAWREIGTKEELNYMFWDQELANRYEAEERLGKIISYASFIAIIILAMGLFGLTVLISAQRIKEIGVRKVNGANVIEVLMLLNSDYLRWVFIALVVACPIAFFLLKMWLRNFAYKTDISWWIFISTGLIALVVALITVSFQSFKAASKNPVEALRYE